jgi:hypothetical protein
MIRFFVMASAAVITTVVLSTSVALVSTPANAQLRRGPESQAPVYRDCKLLSHDYASCMECGSDWPRAVQHKWCIAHGFAPTGVRSKGSRRQS